MEVTITPQNIITFAALVTAIGVLMKLYNKLYDMFKHQDEQDKKIDSLKTEIQEMQKQSAEESGVMARALLGVLNGLIEQGCNGTVHSARDELQEYLTKRGT